MSVACITVVQNKAGDIQIQVHGDKDQLPYAVAKTMMEQFKRSSIGQGDEESFRAQAFILAARMSV